MRVTSAHVALLNHILDLMLLIGDLEQKPMDEVLPELVDARHKLAAARKAAGMNQ